MGFSATGARVGAMLILAACAATQGPAPAPSGPRGPEPSPVLADCSRLVPIYADDTAQGLAREAAWLSENRPGASVVSRTEERCGDTPVHRVAYAADGVPGVVLFDVSSYYGRVRGEDLDDLLDG